MEPRQHVAHVAQGVVRVELYGPRSATRTAPRQRINEPPHDSRPPRCAWIKDREGTSGCVLLWMHLNADISRNM